MRAQTLILAAFTALAAIPVSAQAAEVEITLTGVEARGGQMLISLQSREDFMQPTGRFGAKAAVTKAGTMQVQFKDVPPGEYALSALHDENGDYQMQSLPDGRPAEGWAMHNGAALRAQPTFDAVKLTIGEGANQVREAMIYPPKS